MATSAYNYLDPTKKKLNPEDVGAAGADDPYLSADPVTPAQPYAPAPAPAAATPAGPAAPAMPPAPGAIPPPPPPPPPTPLAPPVALSVQAPPPADTTESDAGIKASIDKYMGDGAGIKLADAEQGRIDTGDPMDPNRQTFAYGGQPSGPGGDGLTWGNGWHDGTPAGKAAWEAAGSPGADGKPTKEVGTTKTTDTTGGVANPSLNPKDYGEIGTSVDANQAAWDKQFQDWLSKQMGNASPYDDNLIKSGQAVLADEINRSRTTGRRSLGEYFSGRGLTASSLEAEQMVGLEGQLQEQDRKGNFELGQAQVAAYQKQLEMVGNLGLGYANHLTSEQRNQIDGIISQMSLSMQKYGIDKQSADAQASRQLSKELQEAALAARKEEFHDQAVLDYGGNATTSDWDSYASLYGAEAATADLGPRPAGATGTTPAGTPADPGKTSAEQVGADKSTYATDLATAKQTITSYAVNLQTKQAVWDQFAAKYGDEAQVALGPRPGTQAVLPTPTSPRDTVNNAYFQGVQGGGL